MDNVSLSFEKHGENKTNVERLNNILELLDETFFPFQILCLVILKIILF